MSITNTSKQDPVIHLVDAMLRGPSESIEHTEAQGARELASQSSRLPSDGLADPMFVTAGLIVGVVDPADPLFTFVTLPAGWQIRITDHNMWTDLVDAAGRVRAKIFYKAAYYDRRAFIRPRRRFSIDFEYDADPTSTRRHVLVKDGDTVIRDYPWREGIGSEDGDETAAQAWLNAEFPQWREASAYWD